jgi:hypothetical protein
VSSTYHALGGSKVRLSFNRLVVALFLMGASVGCSGSDDGDSSGSLDFDADAALADQTCYIGLEVPGVSYTGVACSGGDTYSSVSGVSKSFDTALRVSLDLTAPPAVGALSVSSLTIDVPSEGTSRLWDAPSSCTAVATDTSVERDFGWDYYRIDISCTEPALPASDNPEQPLELGNFSIVTFFDQG